MQNGTFNQCDGTFYDSGGAAANYGNNENYVLTICPPNAGDAIRLDFTSFSTQLNKDIITIYNGPDISSPLLGSFSGGSTKTPISLVDVDVNGIVKITGPNTFVDASSNNIGPTITTNNTEFINRIMQS